MSWHLIVNTEDDNYYCYHCDRELGEHVEGKCLFGPGIWRRGRGKLRFEFTAKVAAPTREEATSADWNVGC